MCQVWCGYFLLLIGRKWVYKQSIKLQMIDYLWIWWIKPMIHDGSVANPHCWIFCLWDSYLCYLPGWNKLGAGIINNNLKLDHKSLPEEPGHPRAEGVCMNIHPVQRILPLETWHHPWSGSIKPPQPLSHSILLIQMHVAAKRLLLENDNPKHNRISQRMYVNTFQSLNLQKVKEQVTSCRRGMRWSLIAILAMIKTFCSQCAWFKISESEHKKTQQNKTKNTDQ